MGRAGFNYLWARSVALPDAIVEEVGRLSRKMEVELETLEAADIAAAALVEAPLYRKGEEFFDGEWRSVQREEIKGAVRDRKVRLLVATDAACEGLNLQTLGSLINVDLPWNPSRLEQRIGRIKRIGQARSKVDMLCLVYAETSDEKVYRALSQRMRDRYNLFGSLPDTIEDKWIDDIENLQEYFSQFTQKKQRANAFDLRYGKTVMPAGPGWEFCEKVLARRDVVERLSAAW